MNIWDDVFYETIYEKEHYLIPYSEMGSWYAYVKDLSLFVKDEGHLQIEFIDAFSKYKIKQTV